MDVQPTDLGFGSLREKMSEMLWSAVHITQNRKVDFLNLSHRNSYSALLFCVQVVGECTRYKSSFTFLRAAKKLV
jgi:hypothetical protein